MKKPNIVIIDYGLGNLFSVRQAFIRFGVDPTITADITEINNADAIVIPGVGAYKCAMDNMREAGIIEVIKERVEKGVPFLGVCLGLQLLFSESEEFDSCQGLGLVKGKVVKFAKESNLRIPQIGWNSIEFVDIPSWESSPLNGINSDSHFYFVHSYYVVPSDSSVILSKTTYGSNKYASAIQYKNIFACQFHPEKSGEMGLKIYQNWLTQNNLV